MSHTETALSAPLSLSINSVINFEGDVVRLLAAEPARDLAYVIPIGLSTALPFRTSFTSLKSRGTKALDPSWDQPLSPSPASKKVRETRYARIEGLVQDAGIFESKSRGRLLRQHAQKVGASSKTLLADLRTWWQGGQVKDALIANYHRSGRVTENTPNAQLLEDKSRDGVRKVLFAPCGDKPRGRRPIDDQYTPYVPTPDEKARFLAIATARYCSDRIYSLRSTATHVALEMYAARDDSGNIISDAEGNALLPPLGRRPTHKQIRYALLKYLCPAKTYAKRNGMAEFLNNKSASIGSVFDDCISPGDVYEVDETKLDLHIVSETDITRTLGKPTLHIVVDRYSRLIVGFHLSLDASNWEDGKLALLSVAQDWKGYCEEHQVAYSAQDFPAEGVMPNRVFADRGPHVTFASDALGRVGIELTNAPALLSRSKSIVEGTFRRINKLLVEVPGYEPQWNVNKRRRKPYEKDACLTLKQAESVLLRAVIALNRETLKDYPMRPEETQAGLMPVPRDIWPREAERLNALPRRVSRDWLQRNLLSVAKATVTQKGIRFKENFYTGEYAVQKDWFALAKINGAFEVEVAFTPKNLDEILVEDPHDPDIKFTAELTSKSKLITGEQSRVTDTQSTLIASAKRAIRREAKEANEIVRASFVAGIAKVTTAAKQQVAEAIKGKSAASRKKDVAEVRAGESAESRKALHHLGAVSAPVSIAVEQPPPTPMPVTTAEPVVVDSTPDTSATPDFVSDFLTALQQ